MNIEISTERLSLDINTMKEMLTRLNVAKERVFSQVDALNGMWIGPAHEIFQVQVREDTEMMNELIQEIGRLIECMEHARGQYDVCEDEVERKIATVRMSL